MIQNKDKVSLNMYNRGVNSFMCELNNNRSEKE